MKGVLYRLTAEHFESYRLDVSFVFHVAFKNVAELSFAQNVGHHLDVGL